MQHLKMLKEISDLLLSLDQKMKLSCFLFKFKNLFKKRHSFIKNRRKDFCNEGLVDAVIERNIKNLHICQAAVVPIIKKAGGIITTWDGKNWFK